jgi:aminocarboxymuconate-semialdehyde decarboxylase
LPSSRRRPASPWRRRGPGQGRSSLSAGTDYPFPWTSTSVDHIITAPGFSAADRIAMLGGNAARLLGIAAA